MSKNKGVRATLVNLWQRSITILKGKGENIYLNGDNNLYPYEIEAVINSSSTALRAASVMAQYINGDGVYAESEDMLLEYDDLPIVNKKKNYKITDIIEMAARSISKQNGVWFHVYYGFVEGKIKPVGIDVLDYVKPRISKEDTEDNPGKIYVKDWDNKTAFGNKDNDKEWFYPFNSNEDVVFAQIKADNNGDDSDMIEAIKNYRGQVYYLNLTPEYKYALSLIHAAYNDADTENRISIYTNKQTRDGFLGKTVVLAQGLDDEQQEEEFNENLKNFLGAEESSELFVMKVDQVENLDNVLKVIQLKPQFDDKLFDLTDKRISRNISGSFKNIPSALVFSSDGALFGTNPETYNKMKVFYSEQTKTEREKLERALYYMGFPIKIKPIAINEAAK